MIRLLTGGVDIMAACPHPKPAAQLLRCVEPDPSAWRAPGVLRGLEQEPGHVPGLFQVHICVNM